MKSMVVILCLMALNSVAFAVPTAKFSFNGNVQGVASPLSSLQLTVFSGSCNLYTQNYASIVLDTAGNFSVNLDGSGSFLGSGGYTSLSQIFDVTNTAISGQSSCTVNGSLSTTSWGVSVVVNSITLTGSVPVNAVPFAVTAQSSNNTTALQGVSIASTAPTTNQVLEYVGGVWTPTTLTGGVTSVSAGTGISVGGTAAAPVINVSTVPVANGGTGQTSGTSGGIPYYSGTTAMSSSALLAANSLVLGGGAGAAPATMSSLGTSGQVLTSNGAGTAPTWQTVAAGGVTSVTAGAGITVGGTASAPTVALTTPVSVASGGTGLASGTSGGIPYFSATATLSSSAVLSSNQVMVGGGAGASPSTVVAPGGAGLILTSTGASTLPSWQTASGSSLGTATATTSPQIAGDATSGLYTAGAGKVDVSIAGNKIVEFNSSGEAITANSVSPASALTVAQSGTGYAASFSGGSVGIGTTAPVDPLSIGTAPNASATHALVNLSNTALVSASSSGTYLAANPSVAGADFINYQVGGTTKFKVDSSGLITGNGSGLTGISGVIAGLTTNGVPYAATSTTIATDTTNFSWNDINHVLILTSVTPATDAFIIPSAPKASATASLVRLGISDISGGNSNGTYIGANPSTNSADYINFQSSSVTAFKVDSTGSITGSSLTLNRAASDAYVSTSSSVAAPGALGTLPKFANNNGADNNLSGEILTVNNSSAVYQQAYMGALSVTGSSVYSPAIVFGQSTGATAYKERMRIDQNGNVGIGISAPVSPLTVYSATSGALTIIDGTQGAGKVLTSNATGTATWQAGSTQGTALTLYVLSSGSDSLCNGSANLSSGSAPNCAFATLQGALASLPPVLNAAVTISISGTISTASTIVISSVTGPGGSLNIVGVSPASTILSCSSSTLPALIIQSGNGMNVSSGAPSITFTGLQIAGATSSNNLMMNLGGVVSFTNVTFSGGSGIQTNGGYLMLNAPITIAPNSSASSNAALSVNSGQVQLQTTGSSNLFQINVTGTNLSGVSVGAGGGLQISQSTSGGAVVINMGTSSSTGLNVSPGGSISIQTPVTVSASGSSCNPVNIQGGNVSIQSSGTLQVTPSGCYSGVQISAGGSLTTNQGAIFAINSGSAGSALMMSSNAILTSMGTTSIAGGSTTSPVISMADGSVASFQGGLTLQGTGVASPTNLVSLVNNSVFKYLWQSGAGFSQTNSSTALAVFGLQRNSTLDFEAGSSSLSFSNVNYFANATDRSLVYIGSGPSTLGALTTMQLDYSSKLTNASSATLNQFPQCSTYSWIGSTTAPYVGACATSLGTAVTAYNAQAATCSSTGGHVCGSEELRRMCQGTGNTPTSTTWTNLYVSGPGVLTASCSSGSLVIGSSYAPTGGSAVNTYCCQN